MFPTYTRVRIRELDRIDRGFAGRTGTIVGERYEQGAQQYAVRLDGRQRPITFHESVVEAAPSPDHERRMEAARKRCEWEFGSPHWAGVIIGAYLNPDEDEAALRREQEE